MQNLELSTSVTLEALGWQPWFAERLPADWTQIGQLGRVVIAYRDRVRVCLPGGDVEARFRKSAQRDTALPAVGDWILLSHDARREKHFVEHILPRKTAFSRRAAGSAATEQVIAANVDTVFLVESLESVNPRRLERVLVVAWASGAHPVVLVNKADLHKDSSERLRQIQDVAHGVTVHTISAKFDVNLDVLAPYCQIGQTIALIGSSGAGKSTLANRLVGADVARTGEIRGNDLRGRHTTTHRELIQMPRGGLIIDTPGLREIQLWDARGGVEQAFPDIETLAGQCRFRDCRHTTDVGCAVTAAIAAGELDPIRLDRYHKLGSELRQIEAQVDQQARLQSKQQTKATQRHRRTIATRN
jgi:ribosome biogenesis GTPase